MRKFGYILFVAIVFFSCKSHKDKLNDNGLFGGTLRINETEFVRTFYPHEINDIVSSHIALQIYDGLVKFDPRTLTVVPAIARTWEIDKSETVFTFYLNDNVFFHDDACFSDGKGRKVTANDFKYTFELLCNGSDTLRTFSGTMDNVVGAKKYYEATKAGNSGGSVDGIKVISDSVLQITLEKPILYFLNILASPAAVVLPREAYEKYGKANHVGCGPFIITEIPKKDEPLYLIRNNNYYKKDKKDISLPYLDTIKVSFISSTQKELALFENGEIDMVLGLPTDYINRFFEKHKSEFGSNPPLYALENVQSESTPQDLFNVLRSNVKNFYTNNMSYIDLSIVYFEIPKPAGKDTVK